MLTLIHKHKRMHTRTHTHTHTHTHTQSLYISTPSTGDCWYIIHFASEASVTRCTESEPCIDALLLFQHSLWFQVIPGRRRLGRCRKNCQRKRPSPSLWQRWMKWHVSLNDFVWCVYECVCVCHVCLSFCVLLFLPLTFVGFVLVILFFLQCFADSVCLSMLFVAAFLPSTFVSFVLVILFYTVFCWLSCLSVIFCLVLFFAVFLLSTFIGFMLVILFFLQCFADSVMSVCRFWSCVLLFVMAFSLRHLSALCL